MTPDEITELVLRIQAEDETEAANLLDKALRDEWMEGFKRAEAIAMRYADKITDSVNKLKSLKP